MLPACNPLGVELTYGWNRIENDSNTVLQGKMLLRELQTNGVGFAAALGSMAGEPFLNGISSISFMFQLTREEWESLRSQMATLKTGRGQHRKYLPLVFTEHGAICKASHHGWRENVLSTTRRWQAWSRPCVG